MGGSQDMASQSGPLLARLRGSHIPIQYFARYYCRLGLFGGRVGL